MAIDSPNLRRMSPFEVARLKGSWSVDKLVALWGHCDIGAVEV
jgi:hypothetical protein